MTLQAVKNAVRLEIKNRLANLSEESKSLQSSIVTKQVLALNEYKSAKRVGIYLSMPSEVKTDDIVKDLLHRNIKCYIPWYKSSDMVMVKLNSLEDFMNLPNNKWGIKQPVNIDGREDAMTEGGLDLIIVPGLGFSLDGHRLGRGKGYYDRCLSKMSKQMESLGKTLFTVGLAFREQIAEIPTEPTDYKINKVLHASY